MYLKVDRRKNARYYTLKRGKDSYYLGRLTEASGMPVMSWQEAVRLAQRERLDLREIARVRGLFLTEDRETWSVLTVSERHEIDLIKAELVLEQMGRAVRPKADITLFGEVVEAAARSRSPSQRQAADLVKGVVRAIEQARRGIAGADKYVSEQMGLLNWFLMRNRLGAVPQFEWDAPKGRTGMQLAVTPFVSRDAVDPIPQFTRWLQGGGVDPKLGVCVSCGRVYVKRSGQDRQEYCRHPCKSPGKGKPQRKR